MEEDNEFPGAPQPRLLQERPQKDSVEGSDDSDGSDEYVHQDVDEDSDDSDEYVHQDVDKDLDDEDVDEEGDEEEVAEELRCLRKDVLTVHGTMPGSQVHEAPAPTAESQEVIALERVEVLRMAFPQTPATVIEAEVLRHPENVRKAYDALETSHSPVLGFDQMMKKYLLGLATAVGASSLSAPKVDPVPVRPLIQVVESNDGPDDAATARKPPVMGAPLEAGENQRYDNAASPQAPSAPPIGVDTNDTSSDGSSLDSDTSSDSTSSGGNTESSSDEKGDGSDSSDEDSGAPIGWQSSHEDEGANDGDESYLESSSESESSSDGSGSETDSSSDAIKHSADQEAEKTRREGGQAHSATWSVPAPGQAVPAAPQQALTKTQKRNARRRRSMARRLTQVGAHAPSGVADDVLKAIEERKQQLLQSMGEASGVAQAILNAEKRQGDVEAEEEENGDAADKADWRQKVTYLGVECCQQGVELSEPPFPFEQRWDPQQQGSARQKRKRASRGSWQDGPVDGDSGLYMDDVAALTGDVGSLADLEAGGAKEGMVITWKEIAMSKATRWQPLVVQRTGTVLAGGDEEKVRVLLAKRDREDRSRVYDERTGQRVYDGFEMPDADSGDEDEDDGERTLTWAELTEPKVVRGVQTAEEGCRG